VTTDFHDNIAFFLVKLRFASSRIIGPHAGSAEPPLRRVVSAHYVVCRLSPLFNPAKAPFLLCRKGGNRVKDESGENAAFAETGGRTPKDRKAML